MYSHNVEPFGFQSTYQLQSQFLWYWNVSCTTFFVFIKFLYFCDVFLQRCIVHQEVILISNQIYFSCYCLCIKNYSMAWQITRLQKKLSPGLCSVLLPAWLIMWCTYVINKYLTNVLWKGSVRAFLHLPTKLGLPQQNHSTFITNLVCCIHVKNFKAVRFFQCLICS